MLRFNSTTVQLILLPTNHLTRKTSFQFHNGTINTLMEQQQQYNKELFQFHNGTINTRSCCERTHEDNVSIPQRYN